MAVYTPDLSHYYEGFRIPTLYILRASLNRTADFAVSLESVIISDSDALVRGA